MITTTGPVVAVAGTVTVILVRLQFRMLADTPLNVTAPLPVKKLLPRISTVVPTGPADGVSDEILGGGMTVNVDPLLACPPTVTTTGPVVIPAGAIAVIAFADQFATVAVTPLKVTALLPCVAPKLEPLMVTAWPTIPLAGESDEITGDEPEPTVNVRLLLD